MKAPKILYEDQHLLVLAKPAGLVVNRAQTTKETTLQDWIENNFKFEISNSKFYRNGIVHRLDKETSGVMVVAKTPTAFSNLQQQFKERKVKKYYLALVHGKVQPEQGVIRAPISRSPFDRKKFGIFLGGREAETEYKVLAVKEKEGNFYSLLEVRPKTGRTHQVRVHLKYLGYPLVGDEFYAGRKTVRADRQWCPRQFLHAQRIIFFHPQTGKKLDFSSPLPPELKNALKYLEK